MKYNFKVLTFFNMEIISITVIFILMSLFGIRYLIKNNDEINQHTKNLVSNQYKITKIVRDFNLYLISDQILFSNSLTLGDRGYLNIDSSLNILLKIHSSKNIESLIEEKRKIFNNIMDVRMGKIDKMSTIPVIVSTKSGIFNRKVDKIRYKDVVVIDKYMVESQMAKMKNEIDFEIAKNAKKNSDINSQIRIELFSYISSIQEDNDKETKHIFAEIDNNFRKYLLTIFILMAFLITSIYFLRYDINKKERSEKRAKMAVDQLIENQINNK